MKLALNHSQTKPSHCLMKVTTTEGHIRTSTLDWTCWWLSTKTWNYNHIAFNQRMHQPFTSRHRTLSCSQLYSPHPVRFNLLVRWHAVRLFVMGCFPPILWFHLLLIQFQCQEERKGGCAPAPDVSCVVQTGELLLRASKWDTTCKYMHVLRVVTSMCEDLNEIT